MRIEKIINWGMMSYCTTKFTFTRQKEKKRTVVNDNLKKDSQTRLETIILTPKYL